MIDPENLSCLDHLLRYRRGQAVRIGDPQAVQLEQRPEWIEFNLRVPLSRDRSPILNQIEAGIDCQLRQLANRPYQLQALKTLNVVLP